MLFKSGVIVRSCCSITSFYISCSFIIILQVYSIWSIVYLLILSIIFYHLSSIIYMFTFSQRYPIISIVPFLFYNNSHPQVKKTFTTINYTKQYSSITLEHATYCSYNMIFANLTPGYIIYCSCIILSHYKSLVSHQLDLSREFL